MITCNKCGYDKAVQGLNEIWCDKCDVIKHGPLPKSFPPIQANIVLDRDAENPVKYVDSMKVTRLPATPNYTLDETAKLDIRARIADGKHVEHRFARLRDIWGRADAYFAKEDICGFVNEFFHAKMPDFWLNLSHGDRDMWSAVLCADGNPVISYHHKNLQSLCCILEKAFDERPDTPGDGIMLIVRTAVEDYFNDED